MTVHIQGGQIRSIALGVRVAKGPVTNPQTASSNLFTVSGGRVVVTSLIGIVTTAQGATANSLNVTHDPEGAGAEGDISAATVCTSDAVGTLYSVTGVATALLSALGAAADVPTHTSAPLGSGFVLPAGTVKLKASANNTGATSWVLTYVPLDDGASVAAA